MVNEDDMRKALAEIESSSDPNYTAIAKKNTVLFPLRWYDASKAKQAP